MRITKKKLEFPKELKDKCNRYLSHKILEITCFDGYMVKFAGTNISTISPHKILLKSKEKEVVILYYINCKIKVTKMRKIKIKNKEVVSMVFSLACYCNTNSIYYL